MAFRARKVFGTFEKRAPGDFELISQPTKERACNVIPLKEFFPQYILSSYSTLTEENFSILTRKKCKKSGWSSAVVELTTFRSFVSEVYPVGGMGGGGGRGGLTRLMVDYDISRLL